MSGPLHVSDINRAEYLDTLVKGLAALRLFGSDMKSLSIQETADRLGLSRSAARRILVTLEHLGYVRSEERRFRPTALLLEFGYSYLTALSLPEVARPAMQVLSARLEESVALAVLDGVDAVYVERVQPPQPFRIDFNIGSRLPAYAFSLGQVLLAGLPNDELDEYFNTTELKPISPLTVVDEHALRRIVDDIRRDGYRLGVSDVIYGVGGIAVPLRNQAGETVAVMAVPIFHGRNQDEMVAKYLPAMLETTAELSSLITRSRDG
jgi:IclR family pca regulon transcriptional regulator